ncbi:MAG: Spy/CpxP family protein refolding chaperone, partial [Armatimonadota bacterium]
LGQELNLTDAQKTTIKGIADAKMAAIKPLVEQIPALHKKVADQMLSSKPDATIVKAALASASQIRAQIAEIGVDFWVAVRGALTDDQNVKLTETLKARQQRGMGRAGGMGNANRQGGPNGSAPGDGQGPPPPGGDAPEADPGQ